MVTHSYEVVPTGWKPGMPEHNLPFLPFVMEVPGWDNTPVEQAKSARRAYFSVMALLAPVAEPEDFQVFDYFPTLQQRGNERGPDGLEKVVI